jgi:signal transduction histidine kinase
MPKLFGSLAFRLALGYGALVVAAMMVISAVFYFGTVGVIRRGIDTKLSTISQRLVHRFELGGVGAIQQEIQQLLTDGIDQDTEVYLLLDSKGRKIVGNLSPAGSTTAFDQLTDKSVSRYDRPSTSRLLPHRLPNGDVLVVGRDLQDLREIEQLVLRSILIGGVVALLLATGGMLLFRMQLENRVANIRRTALEIETGDLSRRIPLTVGEDEFSRLNRDINRMLDHIQNLMKGVREVSNAIAHDLRTPLGRIRSLLDEALRPGTTAEQLREMAQISIQEIDDLIGVFDKLLQIAEAESGTRRRSFQPIELKQIIIDVVELFDATAEANGVELVVDILGNPMTVGDKALLMNATVNLIDNALKYAGGAATIRVGAQQDPSRVWIFVEDDGPGIRSEEREKVVMPFYRLDRSRSRPGNGLGLSIVAAISHLHDGKLRLEDAGPGLIARIVLPRVIVPTLPNGSLMETAAIGTAG